MVGVVRWSWWRLLGFRWLMGLVEVEGICLLSGCGGVGGDCWIWWFEEVN